MKVGIIVAMASEFELASQNMTNKHTKELNHLKFMTGELITHEVILTRAGMGKVNAAIATTEMINNFHPDYIINTGIAGALDKSLNVMDVVIAPETTYHDAWYGEGNVYGQVQDLPARFSADNKLLNATRKIQSDLKIRYGLTVSGDLFVTKLEELQHIKHLFPEALAVDMESNTIAQVCYLYNTPFLSVRLISDTPGITNHAEQYQNFWSLAPEKSFNILEQIVSYL